MPQWVWQDKVHNYRNLDTGEFVSAAQVIAWSGDATDGSADAVGDLSGMLVGGQLNVRDWTLLMRDEVKDAYVQQYLLGKGGLDQMDQKDWGSIGGMLKEQYKYLDNFAKQIAAGDVSPGRIGPRARMYSHSAREAYFRAYERTLQMPKLPDYPGSGNTLCMTNCKCYWEIVEVRGEDGEIDHWDAFWRLSVAEHCSAPGENDHLGRPIGCVQRASKWRPLRLYPEGKKGGEGSGHYGHEGVPGEVGGSKPSGRQLEQAGQMRLPISEEFFEPDYSFESAPFDLPENPSMKFSQGDDEASLLMAKLFTEHCKDKKYVDCWRQVELATRGKIKSEIVERLAEVAEVDADKINNMIASWAQTSNDSHALSLSIQATAAREFGIPLSSWQQMKIKDGGGIAALSEKVLEQFEITEEEVKRYVHAVYDVTQERLEDLGFSRDDRVLLFRGASLEGDWVEDDWAEYNGNAIESWSLNHEIAEQFKSELDPSYGDRTGVSMSAWVPVKDIVGTSLTGMGCYREGEIVVAGSILGNMVRIQTVHYEPEPEPQVTFVEGPFEEYDDDYNVISEYFEDESGNVYTEDEVEQYGGEMAVIGGYEKSFEPPEDEEPKPIKRIIIDDEVNDDWMKSLPGYKDEVKLHDELAKEHGAEVDEKGSGKSGHYGHEGRPGRVGGSKPSKIAAAEDESDFDYGQYVDRTDIPRNEQRILENMLQEFLPRHLDGLTEVTTRPDQKTEGSLGVHLSVDADGRLQARGSFDWDYKYVLGIYDWKADRIHIGPEVALHSDEWLRSILSHEIGHHVAYQTYSTPRKQSDATYGILSALEAMSGKQLAAHGLREQSLYSGRELLAESFVAWMYAPDKKWRKLNGLAKANNIDLIAMFGKRKDRTTLAKLRVADLLGHTGMKEKRPYLTIGAHDVGDLTIFTLDPVEVDPEVAKELPWAYFEDTGSSEKGGEGSGHHGHEGRPGQVGGSKPDGEGPLTAMIDEDVAQEHRAPLEDALGMFPPEHLEGLASVTTELTDTITSYSTDGKFVVGKYPNSFKASGFYNDEDGVIHIAPGLFDDDEQMRQTLVHEIGHHVTISKLGERSMSVGGRIIERLVGMEYHMWDDLGSVGLRRYSMTNGREVLADAYKAWLYADDETWGKLWRLARDAKVDLTEIIGPRSLRTPEALRYAKKATMKRYGQIVTREVDGVLYSVVEPVDVPPDAVARTPWLFQKLAEDAKGGEGSGHHGHEGRPGQVGGSKPGAEREDRTELYNQLLRFWKDNLATRPVPESTRKWIGKYLDVYPKEHIHSLSSITCRTPRKATVDQEGHWLFGGENKKVDGQYDSNYRTIWIAPYAFGEDWRLNAVLGHEIGHHVSIVRLGIMEAQEWGFTIIDNYDRAVGERGANAAKELARFGLRPYSLTSGLEAMADAYLCWVHGSDEQWEALHRLTKGTKADLASLFGERQESLSEPRAEKAFTGQRVEIVSEQEGDTIISRFVLADVSPEVVAQVPWLYPPATEWDAKGGEGSGHHDHEGRPGQVGGSKPSGVEKVPDPMFEKWPGDFESLEELDEWATKRYPGTHFAFDGMDLKLANAAMKQFHTLAKSYPDVAKVIRYVGSYSGPEVRDKLGLDQDLLPGAWGMVKGTGHVDGHPTWSILLDDRRWDDYDQFSAAVASTCEPVEGRKVGWHPIDCTSPESIMTHEFGHVVDHYIDEQLGRDRGGNGYGPYRDYTGVGTIMYHQRKMRNYLKGQARHISDYAKTRPSEAWAEAFTSMWHTPRDKQATAVKRLGNYLAFVKNAPLERPRLGWQTGDDKETVYKGLLEVWEKLGEFGAGGKKPKLSQAH